MIFHGIANKGARLPSIFYDSLVDAGKHHFLLEFCFREGIPKMFEFGVLEMVIV